MLDNGRGQTGLRSSGVVRPEIVDYSVLPVGVEGMMMQMASVKLMTGFESPEDT